MIRLDKMEYQNIHLEFIQNAINRMATNSFILKGWTITLISILFALSVNSSNPNFIVLAIFPTFIFWGLDAYYLRQERLFRKLYDHVRKSKIKKDEYFSLDTKCVRNDVNGWFNTLFASTVIVLHGAIIVLIVGILLVSQGGI